MGLREKVALLLIAIAMQIAYIDCMPRSIIENPFEKYNIHIGNRKSKGHKLPYVAKDRSSNDKESSITSSVHQNINIPQTEVYNTGSNRNQPQAVKNNYDLKAIENFRRDAKRKRKIKNHVNVEVVSEKESNTQPSYYISELGSFPEVEYPLSAMETWTPKYWNQMLFNNDNKYYNSIDFPQAKPDTAQNYQNIKPFSAKGKKGLFPVAQKAELNRKNATSIKANDKMIGKLKESKNVQNNSKINSTLEQEEFKSNKLKPNQMSRSQRRRIINKNILSKPLKSRSQLKNPKKEEPQLSNSTHISNCNQSENIFESVLGTVSVPNSCPKEKICASDSIGLKSKNVSHESLVEETKIDNYKNKEREESGNNSLSYVINVLQPQLKTLSSNELFGVVEKILSLIGPVPENYATQELPSYMDTDAMVQVLQASSGPYDTNVILFTNPTQENVLQGNEHSELPFRGEGNKNESYQGQPSDMTSNLYALHNLVDRILAQVGLLPNETVSDEQSPNMSKYTSILPTDYVLTDTEPIDILSSFSLSPPGENDNINSSFKSNDNDDLNDKVICIQFCDHDYNQKDFSQSSANDFITNNTPEKYRQNSEMMARLLSDGTINDPQVEVICPYPVKDEMCSMYGETEFVFPKNDTSLTGNLIDIGYFKENSSMVSDLPIDRSQVNLPETESIIDKSNYDNPLESYIKEENSDSYKNHQDKTLSNLQVNHTSIDMNYNENLLNILEKNVSNTYSYEALADTETPLETLSDFILIDMPESETTLNKSFDDNLSEKYTMPVHYIEPEEPDVDNIPNLIVEHKLISMLNNDTTQSLDEKYTASNVFNDERLININDNNSSTNLLEHTIASHKQNISHSKTSSLKMPDDNIFPITPETYKLDGNIMINIQNTSNQSFTDFETYKILPQENDFADLIDTDMNAPRNSRDSARTYENNDITAIEGNHCNEEYCNHIAVETGDNVPESSAFNSASYSIPTIKSGSEQELADIDEADAPVTISNDEETASDGDETMLDFAYIDTSTDKSHKKFITKATDLDIDKLTETNNKLPEYSTLDATCPSISANHNNTSELRSTRGVTDAYNEILSGVLNKDAIPYRIIEDIIRLPEHFEEECIPDATSSITIPINMTPADKFELLILEIPDFTDISVVPEINILPKVSEIIDDKFLVLPKMNTGLDVSEASTLKGLFNTDVVLDMLRGNSETDTV